ncbi:hypothetical protein, partial [Burkholderia sp. BCC1972]|uniref:hypothetical protein n=1 Tax=Burkholderia sp. BCC1972 TaxID=2817438 RepID=UPI002ABDF93A
CISAAEMCVEPRSDVGVVYVTLPKTRRGTDFSCWLISVAIHGLTERIVDQNALCAQPPVLHGAPRHQSVFGQATRDPNEMNALFGAST